MIEITLPDGSVKSFEQPPTAMDVAEAIGPGLANAALAAVVDEQTVDMDHVIETSVKLKFLTAKDDEGLEIIRHSTAHLLAQAVKQLHPNAQVTIGPVIEDGFYYDFATVPFTPEDFESIEAKMRELVKAKIPLKCSTMGRDEAIEYFSGLGEVYKAEIIRDIDAEQTLSLYTQAEFTDLCRGPHVPHTGHLKHFKLLKIAGAYWRGDHNNEMLQRVYGTAFSDKDSLKNHLHMLEQAALRDHRRLAKQLDLFHFQPESPGMIFWHEKGWEIYQAIERYLRSKYREHGYREIKTPMILDRSLWEKSGHAAQFSKEMFLTQSETREYAIKPMSCPAHIQVFNQKLKSYRELPIRYAEFGCCHRNEPSGAMHGLMRVRGFVQDDGHIFCTEEQIQSEVCAFLDQAIEVYKDLGFDVVEMNLATRPDGSIGTDEAWEKAEAALHAAFKSKGLDYEVLPGEGAFYGPKIEFHLKDCLGRTWQCGTIQVDFSMPERLDASYISEDSSRKAPVMLHRAIVGSIERIIGILIEHYAGELPFWLAPSQIVVNGVSERYNAYASEVAQSLKGLGFRAEADLRNEKIGYKIREQTIAKIPYMLVVGEKEASDRLVSVRKKDGSDLGVMNLEALLALLKDQSKSQCNVCMEDE